jgi:hypothetical protein
MTYFEYAQLRKRGESINRVFREVRALCRKLNTSHGYSPYGACLGFDFEPYQAGMSARSAIAVRPIGR